MDSNFELIDEDLELKLKSFIESRRSDNTLIIDNWDVEVEELVEKDLLRLVDDQYIDGTFQIKLTPKGLKYFKRKDQFKHLERKNTAKGFVETIAEKTTEGAVSAALKHIGM